MFTGAGAKEFFHRLRPRPRARIVEFREPSSGFLCLRGKNLAFLNLGIQFLCCLCVWELCFLGFGTFGPQSRLNQKLLEQLKMAGSVL